MGKCSWPLKHEGHFLPCPHAYTVKLKFPIFLFMSRPVVWRFHYFLQQKAVRGFSLPLIYFNFHLCATHLLDQIRLGKGNGRPILKPHTLPKSKAVNRVYYHNWMSSSQQGSSVKRMFELVGATKNK